MSRPFPTVIQAVAYSVLVIVISWALSYILGTIFNVEGIPTVDNVISGIANLAAFGVVIYLGTRRSNYRLKQAFLCYPRSLLFLSSVVLAVFGLQILVSELDNVVRYFYPMPAPLADYFQRLVSQENVIVSVLLLIVIAPLTEETLFRGVFLDGFRRNYTLDQTILYSALIFALVHLNPWQMVGAFLLGLYLGFLAVRTGSLSVCIMAHALNNSLPLIIAHVLKLNIRGFTSGLNEEVVFQPFLFNLLGAGLLTAGLFLTFLFFKRRKKRAE